MSVLPRTVLVLRVQYETCQARRTRSGIRKNTVERVRIAAFHIRLDLDRQHRTHVVAEQPQFPRSMVR
jgi:hypothetical protein